MDSIECVRLIGKGTTFSRAMSHSQQSGFSPRARSLLCQHDCDLGQNRDRGDSHLSSPPTPPDMRVRIRRFGGLS
jgi:hypothetical protein